MSSQPDTTKRPWHFNVEASILRFGAIAGAVLAVVGLIALVWPDRSGRWDSRIKALRLGSDVEFFTHTLAVTPQSRTPITNYTIWRWQGEDSFVTAITIKNPAPEDEVTPSTVVAFGVTTVSRKYRPSYDFVATNAKGENRPRAFKVTLGKSKFSSIPKDPSGLAVQTGLRGTYFAYVELHAFFPTGTIEVHPVYLGVHMDGLLENIDGSLLNEAFSRLFVAGRNVVEESSDPKLLRETLRTGAGRKVRRGTINTLWRAYDRINLRDILSALEVVED